MGWCACRTFLLVGLCLYTLLDERLDEGGRGGEGGNAEEHFRRAYFALWEV